MTDNDILAPTPPTTAPESQPGTGGQAPSQGRAIAQGQAIGQGQWRQAQPGPVQPQYPPATGSAPGQFPGQGQFQGPGQFPGQGQFQGPGQFPGQGQFQGPGQFPGQGQFQGLGRGVPRPRVFNPEDARRNRVVAALSYVPFLVLVPLLARPNSPFSRAHAGQGLLLFIVNAFFALLFFLLIYALGIRGVGLAIMDVFGIVIEFGLLFFTFKHLLLCLDGQFQEFPYVGKYAFIR